MEAGVAPLVADDVLLQSIEDNFWKPEYRRYKRVPF